MGSRDDIFRDYTHMEQLDDNFEEMVFHKIKRKKKQRAVAASTFGAFLLGGFLFISVTLFLPEKSDPLFTKGGPDTREDVPVTDYVTFAASDDSTDYVIEQVNYIADTGTI
ncbi:MAG: hypothetical protein ABFR36_09345 [Acidobacteriota bacterium]